MHCPNCKHIFHHRFLVGFVLLLVLVFFDVCVCILFVFVMCLVYLMLPVSLDCLRHVSCIPNVASVSGLSSSCVLCTQCCQLSLDCLRHVSCVPNVASVSGLSSSCVLCTQCCQCLWIVFVMCLVYLMLPVSLDCPFLISLSVFSNIYVIR